jgi:hypothetical protein
MHARFPPSAISLLHPWTFQDDIDAISPDGKTSFTDHGRSADERRELEFEFKATATGIDDDAPLSWSRGGRMMSRSMTSMIHLEATGYFVVSV